MRIRSTANLAEVANHNTANLTGSSPPAQTGREILLRHDDERVSPLARAAYHPDDPISQMARSLRGSITALSTSRGTPVRSVAVLGLQSGLEASIIAANLAITYAQLQTPTILVDANFEESRQRELLKTGGEQGLAEALEGEVEARSLIAPSAVRGLSVLAAGRQASDTPILLDGERFHRRAMPLLDMFSMMIVDVGARVCDPPRLCEAIDAAILVVRRNVTPMEDVRYIVDQLHEMNTVVIGTVVAI